MIRKYISRSVLMLVFLDQLVLAGSMSVALWAKTRWLLTDRHLPVQIYIDLFLRLWPFLAATLALAGAYNLHTAVGSIRRILQRTLAGAAGIDRKSVV